MSTGTRPTRIAVVLFCDLVGSTDLKARLGANRYTALLTRHDELFSSLIKDYAGAELLKDTGDGFFAAFVTVSDAVKFALRFQLARHRETWGEIPLRSRIGIHIGELVMMQAEGQGAPKLVG